MLLGIARNLGRTRLSQGTNRTFSSVIPLSAEEISAASASVRHHVGHDTTLRFVAVSLKEPSRSGPAGRQAEVVALNPSTGLASEFKVDLTSSKVTSSKTLEAGLQPMFSPDDCDLAEAIVQRSALVQQILRERYGIDDISRVACDPWSVNLACAEDKALTIGEGGKPARLVQTFLYHRQLGDGLEDNHYAHPIDILPVVDLNSETVVKIDGLDRPAPKIPTASVNYHRDLLSTNSYLQTTWRDNTLKTLNVVQPDGPSFTVSDTNLVEWQKWKFRVGFNYREGLVLHDVEYDGRSVVKRAALVEMAVPYGDPRPPYTRKCAFDVGDYGLGYCANSLELGCDCLGHIHYFDATLSNAKGEPVVKKSAICMHEEDVGLMWKHVEYRNGHNESRRARELVISSIATVVNYEYLFYWRLKQDGMIEYEIKLSGELSTNLLSEGEGPTPSHGVLVADGVNAQVHQHMFCARLDMAVDGLDNVVSEVDVVAEPWDAKKNPYGNAFGAVETLLSTEKEGIRTADQTKARTWKISSSSKKNPINGKPTAYKLIPFTKGAAQPTLLVHPESEVGKKGKFASANLWVTPFSEMERFPASEYTPQGSGKPGVQEWTAADRSLVGVKDGLVLWHAFGVAHVPRIEDFPVMPVEITGFSLKPDNFFSGNPAIDLPPDKNKATELAKGCCSK